MAQGLGRIMVVDDSSTIRELIALNLSLEGYDVQTASDGEECLRLLGRGARGSATATTASLPRRGDARTRRRRADRQAQGHAGDGMRSPS